MSRAEDSPPVQHPDWLGRWTVRGELADRGPQVYLGTTAAEYLGATDRDHVTATPLGEAVLVFPTRPYRTIGGEIVTPPAEEPDHLGRWSVRSSSASRPYLMLGPSVADYLCVRGGDRIYGFRHPEGVRIVSARPRARIPGRESPQPEADDGGLSA